MYIRLRVLESKIYITGFDGGGGGGVSCAKTVSQLYVHKKTSLQPDNINYQCVKMDYQMCNQSHKNSLHKNVYSPDYFWITSDSFQIVSRLSCK